MSRRADLFWSGLDRRQLFRRADQGPHQGRRQLHRHVLHRRGAAQGSAMSAPLQAAIQHLIDNGTYGKIVTKMGARGRGGEAGAVEPDERREVSLGAPGTLDTAQSEPASDETMRVVPLRHPWTWAASVLVVLVAAGVAWSVATNPAFQWPVVARYLFDGQILAGLRRTLELTVAAMALGLASGHRAGGHAAVGQQAALPSELALHLVLPQRARAGAADILVQLRRALRALHPGTSLGSRCCTAPPPTT